MAKFATRINPRRHPAVSLCSLAVAGALSVHGYAAEGDAAAASNIDELRRQIAEQAERLEDLRKLMAREQSKLAEIRHALGFGEPDEGRASGHGAAAPKVAQPENREPRPAPAQASTRSPARLAQIRRALGLEDLGTLRATGTTQVAQAGGASARAAPSGQGDEAQAPVAQIFEQPGILTQPGKYILEPSLQYSYSSSNRLALIGYTVIPALTIGLIDVREVKRNTFTAALTGRMGLTRRLEIEGKLPWVYRSDDSVSRPLATPSSNEQVFNTTGKAIGDIEFTARYQLNDGGTDSPYYVGSLRFKTRTGTDQFDSTTRSIPGFQGLGLPAKLPTGSGFYSLQPGLTFLFPSDPVVFFGGLSYQYSFRRSDLEVRQDDGQGNITVTRLDSVQPGGVVGFNFGMGLALNERSSFSIGYDHSSVGRTRINGDKDPLSVRVQLGTLLLGGALGHGPAASGMAGPGRHRACHRPGRICRPPPRPARARRPRRRASSGCCSCRGS